ncbi:zinc finger protein 32-like [Siniperca chuatsi]|uniref:zinc finger protein 32-like n=1 Tax=Siniperca chuatsi TaxID=119488 RepID=UPI001CE128F4|nr:zinc finger protein 32-like [Siniperca chuatsi]
MPVSERISGDPDLKDRYPGQSRALRLRAVQLPYQAVMQPVRILNGAPVEIAEKPGVHVEPPQAAEEEELLKLLKWARSSSRVSGAPPSAGVDQDQDPEPPHIKEEQEELWTSQEGEQLRGLEEADITKFPFAPVKSEEDDDEEKPQSSQLHQSQTEENRDAEHLKPEADGEDCGGPEPARNFNPDNPLQPAPHDKTSHSSESETDDSCDWEETREPQSGLNPEPVSDQDCNTGKTLVSSSECATSFGHKEHLQKHHGIETAVKPFRCSVCAKRYLHKSSLTTHMRLHSEGKRYSCSVCAKRFAQKANLSEHLTVHTGEKPLSCSVCGKRFARKTNLKRHLTVHTGEKPLSCSVCGKRFARKTNLKRHLTVHTGEKPFSCSVCGKIFAIHGNLRQHLTVHTGEKPFSCSVCDKRFTRLHSVKRHKCVGESSRNK